MLRHLFMALATVVTATMTPGGMCSMGWEPDPVPCTDIFVYGLIVTPFDRTNFEPITNATVTIVHGDYEEQLIETSDGNYLGAGERPGTYQITASADGYEDFTSSDIVVTSEACHVIQEPVGLKMTPTP